MLSLTPAQRRFLRAHAHSLSAIVMIGDAGLTDAVIKETDHSLKSHELIKIKVAGDDRELREKMMEEICTKVNAAPVQHIGKTLIIYRPTAKPKLTLP